MTLSATSLIFTTANYSTAQNVTVTAATDTDAADESVTVENTVPDVERGSAQGDVTVNVDDNEAAPHFTVSPGSVTVVEGGSDERKEEGDHAADREQRGEPSADGERGGKRDQRGHVGGHGEPGESDIHNGQLRDAADLHGDGGGR